MFAIVTPGFMAYLEQATEFSSADYVDVKPLVGPNRKMRRWAGVNWAVSARITGVGTTKLYAMMCADLIGADLSLPLDDWDKPMPEVDAFRTVATRVAPDPARLAELDERLSAWMGLARRFRRPPEELPALLPRL